MEYKKKPVITHGFRLKTRLLLWWYRLWLRENEFHYTYNLNVKILDQLCNCERDRYFADLSRRRTEAHLKDINYEQTH